jgi:hypothetical protein
MALAGRRSSSGRSQERRTLGVAVCKDPPLLRTLLNENR